MKPKGYKGMYQKTIHHRRYFRARMSFGKYLPGRDRIPNVSVFFYPFSNDEAQRDRVGIQGYTYEDEVPILTHLPIIPRSSTSIHSNTKGIRVISVHISIYDLLTLVSARSVPIRAAVYAFKKLYITYHLPSRDL